MSRLMQQMQGVNPTLFNLDEEANDPMAIANNVVKRAFIKTSVLCSVIDGDTVLSVEERSEFNAAEYALQAHKKFGKCRVLFFRPSEDLVWREIRWKNANVGTLYKRPSFVTVTPESVPPELQVAMMCAV